MIHSTQLLRMVPYRATCTTQGDQAVPMQMPLPLRWSWPRQEVSVIAQEDWVGDPCK